MGLFDSQIKGQAPYHTNLPTMLTSFIGREREIAEAIGLLTSSRLVTLTGAAGSGKTRLALRVATEVSANYAGGVYCIELARLSDPHLVPRTVARALNVADQPGRLLMDTLLAALQEEKCLVVLDNCEHLVDACAQLVESLLSVPDVSILATSREALSVTGEKRYPVPPFAPPPANLPLEKLGQYEAIRLFVERARTILPHFELTLENAAAIVNICQRLDGIPLAIELASARTDVLTVEQIASRLDDRFSLLTAGTHVIHSHHRTLRAAIEWGYELLSTAEQTMLRRLSVFAGGCSLAAAEAVCGQNSVELEQTLELLSSLVDKSLVVAQTLQRREARYSLPETVRQYAQEKLESSEDASAIRDQHLQYFVRMTEETAPKLIEQYQELWLNWLEDEYDNIRAALTWSVESDQIEEGLRIAVALFEYWQKRSYVQEGLRWFERLLERPDEGLSVTVRANALFAAGLLAMVLGNQSATIEYGRKAMALGQVMGSEDKSLFVMTLIGLATSTRAAGDYQAAFEIGERVIQLLRELRDMYRLGRILIMQSGTAMALGRLDVVRALLGEGLLLAREAGDSYRIAIIFNFLGDVSRCEQAYTEAKAHYEKSVALLRELDAARDLASALHNLGHAHLHLGEVERAHRLFTEAIEAQQSQQNTPGMAECLIGFAAIAIVRGQHAAGVRLLSAAIAIGGRRAANVWAATQREYEHYLALARSKLNQTEFKAQEAAGRELSLEQALECVHDLPLYAPQKFLKPPDDLTLREREIATLIAQGKSNGEIADELVLSKRTVEKHIANILSKLAFTTRAQIVRWAIETGLARVAE